MAIGKRSPLKFLPAVAGISAGIGLIGGAISAYGGAGGRRDALAQADEALRGRVSEFEEMKFENVYEGISNPYADMVNPYQNLTVNQQQAQFQAQQGAQSRADIMQSMRGAAGGSGVAGLAQAMANQASLQGQQISSSIGMQEAQNQRLMAQGQMQTEQLAGEGQMKAQQLRAYGASQAQDFQVQRQQALLALAAGQREQAAGAIESARQRQSDLWGGFMGMGGKVLGGMAASSENVTW